MRWPRSIRLRLALATAGVLFLLGGAFGVASYFWLRSSLEQETRSFVLHEAQEIANIVSSLTSREEVLARREILDGLHPEEGVVGLAVLDLDGAVVYQLPEEPGPWSEAWPEGLRAAKAGRPLFEPVVRSGLPPARRTALLVDYQRSPRWVVVAVVSEESELASLARFRELYGVGLVAALVLGYGGCLLLLSMALRPLARMVDDAEQMVTGDPDGLLEVPEEGSELRELATLLNGLLERDRRALESLRRFTAHAGHELRTPLARIRGEAELALTRGDTSEHRECIEGMLEETEALGRVIDALLELARAGDADLADERLFRLEPLLVELVEQARVVGESQTVVLDLPEGADSLWVRGNRVLLDRALWNLLDNALKFGKPGGRVELRLAVEERSVEIEVADDGPGFVPSESLFEPFQRGVHQDGAGEVPGLGLGLALSRAVFRRHAGEVTARRDATLGGACFQARLPRGEPADGMEVATS